MRYLDNSPVIDLAASDWKLVAEGNANIVYESTAYPDKVLRLRKKFSGESYNTADIYKYYTEEISIRLGSLCVEMEPVRLNNIHRADLERGSFLANDQFGLLVERVGGDHGHNVVSCIRLNNHSTKKTYDNGMISYTVEFKPKWLLPHPSDNTLCRTCEINKLKGNPQNWCPLDLVSADAKVKAAAISTIAQHDVVLGDALLSYLEDSQVLNRLREIQALDTKGILGYDDSDPISPEFLLAMTSRDCSLRIEVLISSEEELGYDKHTVSGDTPVLVKGRLIDFDRKHTSKRQYWKGLDQKLLMSNMMH